MSVESLIGPGSLGGDLAKVSFTTKRFVLADVLKRAASAIPSRDLIPMLKNFRVEVTPDKISVLATNLDLAIYAGTSLVTTAVPGVFFVSAAKLIEIVNTAVEGDVQVTVGDSTVTISSGAAQWSLQMTDAANYPEVPEPTEVPVQEIPRSDLLRALKTVVYAASTDAGRAMFSLVHLSDGRMVACDGVRYQEIQFPEYKGTLNLSLGAVVDLVRLLRATDVPTVGIGETDSHIVVRMGIDYFLATRLMVVFPDMSTTLLGPALKNDQVLRVNRDALEAAVRRVKIAADPKSNALVLRLSLDQVSVEAQDQWGNRSRETVPASWVLGERTVVVNHRFLAEMLGATDVPVCEFRLGPDHGVKRSDLLLADDSAGALSVVRQMRADWVLESS